MLIGYIFRGGAESAPPCGRHVISEVVAIRVKKRHREEMIRFHLHPRHNPLDTGRGDGNTPHLRFFLILRKIVTVYGRASWRALLQTLQLTL